MKPSKETIKSFKRIYVEEFEEEISTDVAYDKFLRLVNFLRAFSSLSSQDDLWSGVDQNEKNDKLERLQ
jgi:hypothetical protein